jgi:methylmalonyl-CoA mutase N-terminal domain/subunit
MDGKNDLDYGDAKRKWEAAHTKTAQREFDFTTVSGAPTEVLGLPRDDAPPAALAEYAEKLGFPGQFPFTRGIYPNMYRGRLWTMRQFAGFGTARETNQRYQFLLEHGQTGLSVAFDMPTLMGYDADDSHALGEVGKCGVAISSLADMETLFSGIPLDKVSVSMTINGPAPILWAMFIAAAEKQGVDRAQLRGTTQNDILKEYIAQKEWLFPPRPSMRLVTDTVEFGTSELPLWHPISVSGYHIREAGSTAAQELAFTLADGFAYVEDAVARGIPIDSFAPRLSFFFNSHLDFFEEIAKFRAARRIFARRMRDQYGARKLQSQTLRFHTQTAGCTLTAQQPENNIVRTAIQVLAGVLGGTQSLHSNSMDETLALPTEKAAKIALRTQQIIAFEVGVANSIDPLGGSWFVENLTDRMEAEAEEYFKAIDARGGVIAAIEQGYFQREIHKAATIYQKAVDAKEKIIVGVNDFVEEDDGPGIEILKITEAAEKEQRENLAALRKRRDPQAVKAGLDGIRDACRSEKANTMPALVAAVSAYCTLGEIRRVMQAEFGTWQEPSIL